jgi:hypothetical protein
METIELCGTLNQEVKEKHYKMCLEYYLISEDISEDYCNLKRYGVMIKKIATYPDCSKREEVKKINDIFFRLEDAREFMDIVMQGGVTPIALKDIVENHIARQMTPDELLA